MREWIDINASWPDEDKVIVVYSAGKYYPPTIASWRRGYGFTVLSGDRRSCWNVTHWMPLPEMPEKPKD